MVRLLDPDEPDPVAVQNPNGASEILLISDHAGRRIPRRLGTLGLGDADLERHIAWDIGIRDVTTQIADKLGATYIYQRYSRLVIDCNRRPGSSQSIMRAISDGTEVPGNRGPDGRGGSGAGGRAPAALSGDDRTAAGSAEKPQVGRP